VPSAVIVRARLPAALERVRLANVDNASRGVPAHVTLLHPFIEPNALDGGVRARLAAVAAQHRAFEYRQTGIREWPAALYVAVAPEAPFVRLQRDLQATFPEWPIYAGRPGDGFRFVPHITVADEGHIGIASARNARARGGFPGRRRAHALEVIATGEDGRWRLVWRLRLGAMAADRMRP
jgi:2'-5' RNA ligase